MEFGKSAKVLWAVVVGAACTPQRHTAGVAEVGMPGMAGEVSSLRPVRSCLNMQKRDNFIPVYTLYLDIPAGLNMFAAGTNAYLYRRVNGGWEQITWGVISGPESPDRCRLTTSESQCIAVRTGVHEFEQECVQLALGKPPRELGFHSLNNKFLPDGAVTPIRGPQVVVSPTSTPWAVVTENPTPVPTGTTGASATGESCAVTGCATGAGYGGYTTGTDTGTTPGYGSSTTGTTPGYGSSTTGTTPGYGSSTTGTTPGYGSSTTGNPLPPGSITGTSP